MGLDADLLFCKEQIEKQNLTLQAIHDAKKQTNRDLAEVNSSIAKLNEEKSRLGGMLYQLNLRIGEERLRLQTMVDHRNRLKEMKVLLVKQNELIDNSKNKGKQNV